MNLGAQAASRSLQSLHVCRMLTGERRHTVTCYHASEKLQVNCQSVTQLYQEYPSDVSSALPLKASEASDAL